MSNNYFDIASTTAMSEGAITAYADTARNYTANPSSSHAEGKKAALFLKNQRDIASSLLDIPNTSLFYTSGATESNSIVLNSLLWRRRKGRIVVSALEHPSITQYRVFFEERGFEWVYVKSPYGVIDTGDLENKITKDTLMVISMLTHNVFGTIQPLDEVANIIKKKEIEYNSNILFHVDVAQAIGKMKFSLSDLKCNSASMSAHKIGGPRGIGLLYVKEGSLLKPISRGGNQESGMRGGTENLPAISGFTYALRNTIESIDMNLQKVSELNILALEIINSMKDINVLRNKGYEYVDGIISIAINRLPSQVVTRLLNDKGFMVSSTSACSNNTHSLHSFHPLITGFRPELLKGAFRISFNHHHQKQDILNLTEAIKQITPH